MDENKNVATATHKTIFEGQPLAFHSFRGETCIVAADLGRVLGYADDGKSLVEVITKHWADELIEGRDFEVLTGSYLRDFKAILGDADGRSASFTARLMVLTESGVDVVCIKTEKPLGKKLRRFLVAEVMPKLRRGEPILPNGSAAANDAEAQVRLLALRQKEALAIYTTIPGLFGVDFLRHKVEHAAALVTGEMPVVENPLLSVEGYLQARGVDARTRKAKASPFGKRVKALYVEKNGEYPPMQVRDINHSERRVYSYTEKDRLLFDQVFAELFSAQATRALDLSTLVGDVPEPVPPPPAPAPPKANTSLEGWSLRGLLERFKKAGMGGLTTTTIRDAANGIGLIGDQRYGHQSQIKNEHGRVVSSPWRYHEQAASLLEQTLRLYQRNVAGGLGEQNAIASAVAMTGKVGSGPMGRAPFKAIRAPG